MEEESPKPKARVMKENWDPDEFPTSARPVFRAMALLLAIIIGLCGIVYYSSDFEEESAPVGGSEPTDVYDAEDPEL